MSTAITNHGVLYKRGVKGEVRVWSMDRQGDKHRTVSGILNGKMVESKWTTAKAKNVGRSNATTPEQQALAEVLSKYDKQLKSNYFHDIAHIDDLTYLEPMLATGWDKRKDKVDVTAGVFAQPKLDGFRCIATSKGLFTREGEKIVALPHIEVGLSRLFAVFPDMVLDGELYNHKYKDKFEKLASIIRKQTPDEAQLALAADVIQYHIYDIASHEGNFHARNTDMRDVVFERFLSTEGDRFQRVETVFVNTLEYLDSLYGNWMADGYEGQMIRMNEAYQTQRRSNFLIKRKEFDTAEFRVTGMQQGEGNWEGACKQFEIELEDGTPGVATPRGSKEVMEALYESGTPPDWCTVRFFGRTAYGALRFPVAIDYGFGERRD